MNSDLRESRATEPVAGDDRIMAVEIFAAILLVIVLSLGAFQLHFPLAVTAFALILVVVVTAMRLGFWQATLASAVAVVCLDFFFTIPIFSLKTDATDAAALVAFECAALIVSRLSTQVQLQARIATQQRNNMERLYILARNVLSINRTEPIGPQIVSLVRQTIGLESVALFDAATMSVYGVGRASSQLEAAARDVWVLDKDEDNTAGRTWSRVLRMGRKGTGAIVLRAGHLSPIVADAIASIAAIALERSRSFEKETRAQAARESEQLRTAVLDALAHAFKTPLTTIRAASSGLLEAGTLNAPEAELASLIDEQSVVLNELTTRLLQTARLAEEEITLRREECTIRELIDDLLEPFAGNFQHRPANVDIPDGTVVVTGDCGLIVTALHQLVDNAIKYSDPGTGVAIAAERVADDILVSVHNDGPPIQPADRDRIFDRFYRSHEMQHKAAGTGLGLSITRKIAEAHRGRVWTENVRGGPTFYFSLPFIPPSVPGAARRRS